MKQILQFLSGKKGMIASIIGLINGYLAFKGVYGEAEFILIGGIATIVFGVASYQTAKLYK